MTVAAVLDRLVAGGQLSGYTIEADPSYLAARRPTLTYRMYVRSARSRRNLAEFRRAMAGLGAELRTWPLVGTVAAPGGLVRTDQVCVSATFADDASLRRGVSLVERRFTRGGEEAAPGSWRFPDVRVSGGAPPGTIAAWAHRWGPAVALTLSPDPPTPGAVVAGVRVLERWAELLALSPSRPS